MNYKTLLKIILIKFDPFYRLMNNIKIQVDDIKNKLDNIQKLVNTSPPLIVPYDDDDKYLHNDVPLSKLLRHPNWINYLAQIGNKKGMKILEIGSRTVTSTAANFRKYFPEANYVGFDFYHGENVDVVGDAHKLSTYFENNEKFDIIFSSAVFEHLAMPWIVAKEITKLLNINGFVFIETHFSYSSHERPWHFFQFSDKALEVLFSPAMGFKCIESGFSNPIIGRFSSLSIEPLKNKPISGLYCHVEYLGKKIKEVKNFDWNNTDFSHIVGGTKYPKPKKRHCT